MEILRILIAIFSLLMVIALIVLIAWGYKKDYEKSPRYFKAAFSGVGKYFIIIFILAGLFTLGYLLFYF